MGFVIGLLIGLVAGWVIAYLRTSKQVTRQSALAQDLQRQLALAESEHERRLREATEQLRQDYAAQAPSTPSPKSTPAASPPAGPPSKPPATSESSSASSLPTVPLATSPQPATTPVTAAVSKPAPEPVIQSPTIPEAKPSSPSAPAITDARITDPNALLAASYAPDAATRRQVATAIAEALSQSGVQAQARWLPILGRLTRDADATVRLSSIQALEHVSVAKRLPMLQRALKDPDPAVVAAANTLITATKGRSQRPQTSKKRRLPKNK